MSRIWTATVTSRGSASACCPTTAAPVSAGRFGRSLLMGGTRETVPAGEAFARRIGAELGQVMIENRLDLRAVDRDLVRSWVEAGPARAPGYHLEFVRG